MPGTASSKLPEFGLGHILVAVYDIGDKAIDNPYDGELPNVWYATVYPASMVAKIILAQLIVSTILMF